MPNPSKRNSPVRPQILDKAAAKLVETQTISSSSEFLEWVRQQKAEAERRREDLLTEIAQFEIQIQRSQADHDTAKARLDAEIKSRLLTIADEEVVIRRAEIALTIELAPELERPAPQITGAVPLNSLAEALKTTGGQ